MKGQYCPTPIELVQYTFDRKKLLVQHPYPSIVNSTRPVRSHSLTVQATLTAQDTFAAHKQEQA